MPPNYLLGRAEKLVRKIAAPPMKPNKSHPYTFELAQARVAPKLANAVRELAAVPVEACPNGETVAVLQLHPSYLAKTYFPETLLSAVNLRAIGSRSRMVSPEKWAIKDAPESALTAELFVAGQRRDFERLAAIVPTMRVTDRGADELRGIEDFRHYGIDERLRRATTKLAAPFWEIVLHATEDQHSDYIVEGFRKFLEQFDVRVNLDERLYAQGLCFLPARIPRGLIRNVAQYSFLRVARETPRMRPVMRTGRSTPSFPVVLPPTDALDPSIRVAQFDGGLPAQPDLSRWAARKQARGVKAAVAELVEHGLGVSSALLFGHLEQGKPLPQPFANIDHYRVLDDATEAGQSCEYFDVIKRIMNVLDSDTYEFVSLSIGPDLPIEDDDVHVWTAMLDQHLRTGKVLACVAAGNNGENDHASGNARIQSPADCVNGMAVGSSDAPGKPWARSPHSSIGPGRSPGRVKPDVLGFGGSSRMPFYVIGVSGSAEARLGTSFASPTVLRTAIGVRAHLGPALSPLAIKGLAIHRSYEHTHPRNEVGWGKVPESIDELITCGEGMAHIVYQGVIGPGESLQAPIPLPDGPLTGKVAITATFCFASDTDPQDPINYTRAGLEVRFRPNDQKRKNDDQHNPDTKPFFNAGNLYLGEGQLRVDAHKWETTLHVKSKKMLAKSLVNPAFDIHYNARTGGGKARAASSMPDRPSRNPCSGTIRAASTPA